MKNKATRWLLYTLSFSIIWFSCEKKDDNNLNGQNGDIGQNPVIVPETGAGPTGLGTNDVAHKVEFLDRDKVYDGYILVNDAKNNRVYLMDKDAKILHEWPLSNKIGNDVYLLPNGKVLASLQAEEPKMSFGGQGGILQFVDKDGNIEWDFDYSTIERETHHDAELLPNGNVITLVWEKRTAAEANLAGSNMDIDIFPDAVIEIDPTNDEIVWEWHAWDHLVQDFDDSKANFGVIADNPQLIDLNYVQNDKGDITHANGLSYDPTTDLIYISINFFSEVWAIDHSTSVEESASHEGGNYGKGGDLIYRFGNPEAYGNTVGDRLFTNNHYPNLLNGPDLGKMLIFSNGGDKEQSTVYELELPTQKLTAHTDNEPKVVWSFTHPDLYSPKVSGAVRLPNGNTLITEGDYGYWEVTPDKTVVWKFKEDGFFWRGYHYPKDAPEIMSLDIKP